MENNTGFTCNTCGKVFETEEEFLNRHKKNNKKDSQNQQTDNLNKN
jgi:hypothetical protein